MIKKTIPSNNGYDIVDFTKNKQVKKDQDKPHKSTNGYDVVDFAKETGRITNDRFK